MQHLLVAVTLPFGEPEFWARVPSAVQASANVVIAFLLGRRLFNTATGWISALLLAAAPYHVWYAQEAHPYAALSFYSALSAYLLLALLERPTRANAGAHAGVTIVNLATHFCAVFPWLAEAVTVVCWTAARWWREPEFRHDRRAALLPCLVVVATGLGCALIAAPFVLSAADYLLVQGYTFNADIPRVRITLQTIADIFARLGWGNGVPQVVAGASALGGLLACVYFRRWLPLTLFAAWFVMPFAVLALVRPRAYLITRYFLFLQPLYVLLIAWGLAQLPGLCATVTRSFTSSARGGLAARGAAWLIIAALMLDAVPATWNGYWVERLNDWSAMCRYLHGRARPGDMILGEGYVAGTMAWCYRRPGGVSVGPTANYSLSELASRGQNVWYLALSRQTSEDAEPGHMLTAIPRGDWAPRGLLPPYFDNAGRLGYPQAEGPVALFFIAARETPAQLEFRDRIVKGEARSFMWMQPGDYRVSRLRLAPIQARVLRIEYRDLPGVRLRLDVDGASRAEIDGAGTSRWVVKEVALEPELPDLFTVRLINRGSRPAAVSRLEVRYESQHR